MRFQLTSKARSGEIPSQRRRRQLQTQAVETLILMGELPTRQRVRELTDLYVDQAGGTERTRGAGLSVSPLTHRTRNRVGALWRRRFQA